MVDTIDAALVQQFSDQVHIRAQQEMSELLPYVELRQFNAGEVMWYDGLGQVQANKVLGRYQPVTFSQIEHNRRKITKDRYAITLPIDRKDLRAALQDPQGNYARAVTMEMMRVKDRIIAAAAFADVQTGKEGEITLTFAQDGGLTVDATSGLTYESLIAGQENFIDGSVKYRTQGAVLAITGVEHSDLMKEVELTSRDFTNQYAVEKGYISNAIGFDIVTFGARDPIPVLNVNSGERECILMSKGGICLGMSLDLQINVDKRTDYIETDQVQAILELGAVRTEGKLIQKYLTTVL